METFPVHHHSTLLQKSTIQDSNFRRERAVRERTDEFEEFLPFAQLSGPSKGFGSLLAMHKISWTGPRLFVMVGANDNPIYEYSFVTQKESAYMAQFILHAALDLVDEMQWKTNFTFLKIVDKYNDLFISGYVTPGGV